MELTIDSEALSQCLKAFENTYAPGRDTNGNMVILTGKKKGLSGKLVYFSEKDGIEVLWLKAVLSNKVTMVRPNNNKQFLELTFSRYSDYTLTAGSQTSVFKNEEITSCVISPSFISKPYRFSLFKNQNFIFIRIATDLFNKYFNLPVNYFGFLEDHHLKNKKEHLKVLQNSLLSREASILNAIENSLQELAPDYVFLQGKVLELISSRLLNLRNGLDTLKDPAFLNMNSRDLGCINTAEKYLLENMQYPPNLEELARYAGINMLKLKMGFRAVYGMPPYAYLREHRMEAARKMLEKGEDQVSVVAKKVGYTSLSHFAQQFKNYFGVLPSKYRKGI